MSSKELVLAHQRDLTVESLEQQLASADSAEALAEFRARISGFESYFRSAKDGREKYQTAAWLRLLSERQLGKLRLEVSRLIGLGLRSTPAKLDYDEGKKLFEQGIAKKEIARRFGVQPSDVRKAVSRNWVRPPTLEPGSVSPLTEFDQKAGFSGQAGSVAEKLAGIPEEELRMHYEVACLVDASLSANAISQRIGLSLERIERNIYRTASGRYTLKWKKDGIAHSNTLPKGITLKQARERLNQVRRGHQPTPKKRGKTLGDAYEQLRSALYIMDASLSWVPYEVAVEIKEAMAHMHKGEDSLTKALNLLPIHARPKQARDGSA